MERQNALKLVEDIESDAGKSVIDRLKGARPNARAVITDRALSTTPFRLSVG